MNSDESKPWAVIIGPCYRAGSIARELGWSSEQVTAAAAAHELLELRTEDDVLLYPAFQVWEGQLVQGLGSVLQVLSTGTDSTWTWAQWLNSPVDDETGDPVPSAIEQLRAGQLDDVLRDARHTAAAWSS